MFIALAIASTLASVSPAPKPSPDAAASPAASVPDAPRVAAKPTRYCVKEALTGSRMPTRICRTREEWLARDFDPLARD